MITNVYYYNYYTPYILSNFRRKKVADFPRAENFLFDEEETYVLNKALKKEVIGYATELSRVVNGLKDSSRFVVRDARRFIRNEREEGYGTAVKWLEDDLADFVDSYNRTKGFVAKNKDSRILTDFVDNLTYDLSISMKALSRYRIVEGENETLVFDEDAFKELTRKGVLIANKQNYPFFRHVYDTTKEFLNVPLSEHMNFKNFRYYYNYKTGTIAKDSFTIVESGMIVNEVV